MNVITVAGTTGKDAEMKYLSDGTAIASFSIADSQGRDKTVWWNCSLFGKRAESLGQYITKGSKITITGQVTEDVWTDKNGQERKSMKIRVNDVALQGGRRESSEPQFERRTPKPQQDAFDDMSDVPF